MADLDAQDRELVAAARSAIRARYHPGRHAVGCALRLSDGEIVTGVHLDCYVGRISVCAEAVAIGRAATDGRVDDIATIVAVRQASVDDEQPVVVSPCGMCREMISDFAPTARVIVPGEPEPDVVTVADLLPNKYVRPDG